MLSEKCGHREKYSHSLREKSKESGPIKSIVKRQSFEREEAK
jgi:hypothetical protein